MQTIFILGRQPALGRAELESLYGAEHLRPVGAGAVLCALPASEVVFSRLGGVIKLATVIETINSTDWRQLQPAVIHAGVQLSEGIEGKIQLGLSAYDLRISTGQLNAGGLELKKALRKSGHSVRLVPNQSATLNSAQILHNHLTGERGIELLLIRDDKRTIIARTVAEQDIDAYTERDRGRPKRDAFVGMLPPKLAQTIVNLAVGQTPPSPDFTVLDPFCGTGVILQEALLMGYGAYGTDLEPRMIDYSRANLEWLAKKVEASARIRNTPLEVGDATEHTWQHQIDAIACESYLGHPFNTVPPAEKLQKARQTCNTIIEKFLKNIASQLKSGTRLCVAVPAWQHAPGKFTHLPLLDHLGDMGYNWIDFRHAQRSELMYYRPDQVVARELLVIIRK